MKKIRLVTLFSGYDSQAMALERIKQVKSDFDYELVRWCEIDENAIRSNSQLYKLAGNSIVTSCMYYIFLNLFYPEASMGKQETQLSLF